MIFKHLLEDLEFIENSYAPLEEWDVYIKFKNDITRIAISMQSLNDFNIKFSDENLKILDIKYFLEYVDKWYDNLSNKCEKCLNDNDYQSEYFKIFYIFTSNYHTEIIKIFENTILKYI